MRHPCVPIGQQKPVKWPVNSIGFLMQLAEREEFYANSVVWLSLHAGSRTAAHQ
jgi:hypothetical protein